MIKRFCFAFIVFFPVITFAQSLSRADSIGNKIIHDDCDDKLFVKVEILPSLKKAAGNFGDTLTAYLKSKGAFINDTKASFRFLVTTSSHIFEIKKEAGNIQNESAVKEFLASHSFMWNAAIQNGYPVCAYVRIEIEIINDALRIAIKQ